MVTTSRVKKLFALASLSALTGRVAATGAAGCTTETVATTLAQDAGTAADEKRTPPLCYKEDAFDATTLPYKNARVQPGACSTKVTRVIGTILQETNGVISINDLKKGLTKWESQECADCVIAPDGDSWAPIVVDGDQVTFNHGGCLEVVSGSEECGRAYQQFLGCQGAVCKDCKGPDAAECVLAVQKAACSDATKALVNACAPDVNRYMSACIKKGQPDIYGQVLKQCVEGTTPDAGTD